MGGWLTNSWDNPGCHYDLNTYAWPRQVETLMKAMLLAYHKTGEAKYLDPIIAAANGTKNGAEGSWDKKLKLKIQKTHCYCKISAYSGLKVKEVLAMYRDITSDTSYDNILENDIGYYNFVISGNTEKLEADLTRIGNLFSRNLETLTSEVRFTDRIFKFKHNYIDKVFNNTTATSTSFDTLYFTITGDS